MLITYNNTQVDFEQMQSLSVEKGKIIFQTKGGNKIIQLNNDNYEIADEVAEYIINCYKRGFKRLNLNSYISLEAEKA
ncbi:hypothetical protein [Piscirickettsia litoralis]|uniref:Uncharacterized protein n=1 Tax=Piscirickettsia litoralis TaxID=1891921 RepID=A0ABX2ZZ23_9GAMM|nr:hypothetical protein [Piscirickettsia litoralis]ODN41869.1 hypothetical protein BGC07_01410 [Piscirickettsia litoralis]